MPRQVYVNGMKLKDAAELLGFKKSCVLSSRKRRGWTDDEIMAKPCRPKNWRYDPEWCKWVWYKGEKRTYRSLCDEFGLSMHILYNRLHALGWSVERALGVSDE